MLKAVADKAVQALARRLCAVQVLLHSWLRAAVESAASARGSPHPAARKGRSPSAVSGPDVKDSKVLSCQAWHSC